MRVKQAKEIVKNRGSTCEEMKIIGKFDFCYFTLLHVGKRGFLLYNTDFFKNISLVWLILLLVFFLEKFKSSSLFFGHLITREVLNCYLRKKVKLIYTCLLKFTYVYPYKTKKNQTQDVMVYHDNYKSENTRFRFFPPCIWWW